MTTLRASLIIVPLKCSRVTNVYYKARMFWELKSGYRAVFDAFCSIERCLFRAASSLKKAAVPLHLNCL